MPRVFAGRTLFTRPLRFWCKTAWSGGGGDGVVEWMEANGLALSAYELRRGGF